MNAVKVTKPPTPRASTRPGGDCRSVEPGSDGAVLLVVPHAARRQQGQRRGERGKRGSGQQAGIESIMPDHRFADHRPDAQAAEHRDREVARGLGASSWWRQSLMLVAAPTKRPASPMPCRQRSGSSPQRVWIKAHAAVATAASSAPQHHGRAQTMSLGELAEPRPDQDRGDAEDRQVEADVDLVATELLLDQAGAATGSSRRCRRTAPGRRW